MKEQTVYISDDGKQFNSKDDCADYETVKHHADQLMRTYLGNRPSKILDGGNGFVQHQPLDVEVAKNRILDVYAQAHPSHVEYVARARTVPASHSIIGRFMDDDDRSPLRDAWWRLLTIDDQGREWEQMYFARNPNPNAKAHQPVF